MSKVAFHIFPLWTLHFLIWTPHLGWTPRLIMLWLFLMLS